MLPKCSTLNHLSDFIFDINESGLYQINNIWREDSVEDNNVFDHNILDLIFTNDPENLSITKASPVVKYEKCHPPRARASYGASGAAPRGALAFEKKFAIKKGERALRKFLFSIYSKTSRYRISE